MTTISLIADEGQSPEKEDEFAQMVGQTITQAYRDLSLWALPYKQYLTWQRENITKNEFDKTVIAELIVFFIGDGSGGESILKGLVEHYKVDVDVTALVSKVTPLFKEAFLQINDFRTISGLRPYDI